MEIYDSLPPAVRRILRNMMYKSPMKALAEAYWAMTLYTHVERAVHMAGFVLHCEGLAIKMEAERHAKREADWIDRGLRPAGTSTPYPHVGAEATIMRAEPLLNGLDG